MNHEEIVELIGTSDYRIRITIADNYFSDSSDEEDASLKYFRPKYPYSKSRSHRASYESPHLHSRIPPRFHTHPPLPHLQQNVNTRNAYEIRNVSGIMNNPSKASPGTSNSVPTPSASTMMINNSTDLVSFVVGYLGTIEMPKQIATSSKLQTVRSCIRKMRQEKRSPTLVLMNILPNSLNLLNSNNVVLATYPSSRLNFISSSSDNNSKFFGLVTSAKFHDDESHFDSYDSLKLRQAEVAISNSCHVFGIETKLIDHNAHVATAEKFKINCTKDLISNSCLEFPTTSDYICNITRSMYNLKSPEQTPEHNHAIAMKFNQIQKRNNNFHDPHELLLPNSPHPSNHSEITTSSNSDSGIGFHNDLTNISDRILLVNFPNVNDLRNKNVNMQRARKSRPVGIVNDHQLEESSIRNIRTFQSPVFQIQQPSSSRIESLNICHAKSKSADFNYENIEKLAVRAMPLRNIQNELMNNSTDELETTLHPKAVTDVWYDGEMLDEDGNEIHERGIDVSITKSSNDLQNISINMMIRSCDDILMIMDKEDARYRKEDHNENNNEEKMVASPKTDDHVFLAPEPRTKKCKNNNKRSLTLLGKSRTSQEDSKSKHESNLKHYKLSPKVFGLRPVSISFENLSYSSSKRKSLFGSKKNESKAAEDEEDFTIWGSLQELRNCESIKQQQLANFLEGTYSEPNLSYDEVSKMNCHEIFKK